MGRAIIRSPRAFLMDEPLSNLDARLRVQMRAEVARIQIAAKVTTIYVTHDQVEAMTMGDRVAVMDRGVLQQIGTPRTLYDEPANLFVAGFIGSPSMNLMGGRLAGGRDGPTLTLGRRHLALPPPLVARKPGLARYLGRDVVVGIRMEALRVTPLEGDPRTAVTGTIAFVEDLGATLLLHVGVNAAHEGDGFDGTAIEAAQSRIHVSIDGHATARVGDRIGIAIDLERLHVFDAATGAAIGG
jgi:multiple sugar transport system ATP-binding protein